MEVYNTLIFEKSVPGRVGYQLEKLDVPEYDISNLDTKLRKELDLPEVSENEVVRHYINMGSKNYHIDKGFYPLGSCTMKYNPKINEDMARIPNMANIHPKQDDEDIQGVLEALYDTQEYLREIAGMDAMTLQPAAGAHGELTGLMIIKKYHENNKNYNKTKIIVPDSAHGTNPATAAMLGLDIVEIPSLKDGSVDIEELKKVLDEDIAGLMLTNPSTLGLFEKNIKEIADLVHDVGGLLYYDGANMNAIMGMSRPGDMGFDVMHFNVHKTFSTPHGGGGPGAGPVGVKSFLKDYLPIPVVEKKDDKFFMNYDLKNTIGKVKSFYGNYGVILRTYVYILTMGAQGLKKASKTAVLNANYMQAKLKDVYKLNSDRICMHEFVLSGIIGRDEIPTLDIAKRIIDFGFHPPTIYFPLIVNGAIMIEPTETETKETLDKYIGAMKKIAKEDIQTLKDAPSRTDFARVDEVYAAKNLKITY